MSMKMTHKERVRRAFAFEEADRVPLDIGGLNVTSLTSSRMCPWKISLQCMRHSVNTQGIGEPVL